MSSSTNQMFTQDRGAKFKQLKELSTPEKSYCGKILAEIKQNSTDKTPATANPPGTLILIIKQFEAKPEQAIAFIYRISEEHSEIKKFLEENSILQNQWIKYLEHFKYPALSIESIDKQETVSLFSRLRAAYLHSQFKLTNDSTILNEACKLGLYQSLVTRLKNLNLNITNVNDAIEGLHKHEDSKKIDPAQLIVSKIIYKIAIQDADRLGNLFWSAGYINVANTLTNLAKYYCHFPLEAIKNERFQMEFKNTGWSDEEYDNQKLPDYVRILQVALESHYKAKLLEDFPPSKQITTAIYPEKGLFTGFEESYKDWNGADKYFLNLVQELKIPNPGLFSQRALARAKKEAEVIKESHTPKAVIAKK